MNVNATAAGAMFGITADSVAGTFFDMVYNDDLKRLYVSAQMTGENVNGNDSAFGVAIFKVDPDNNTLTKLNQCANQAASIDGNTRIIGFKGQQDVVALRKLGVMKTSTGFYYLIVNV
jgi:6-phosphogluconolactonase (cycloisomerase 2 family)